jgi:hypothetical protein
MDYHRWTSINTAAFLKAWVRGASHLINRFNMLEILAASTRPSNVAWSSPQPSG